MAPSGSISRRSRYIKNDTFYIEAGTVHAIGAGCLMAEIQENSNLTYRMYDYDRQDKYGKKRPLHIERALEVVKLDKSTPPGQPQRVLNYHRGCATERCAAADIFRWSVCCLIRNSAASFWNIIQTALLSRYCCA